jgi:integrator complex subunit 8
MAVCLAAAFLLNTHNYQHLISFDHPFTPGKVAPRLAIAALAMKEDRDARKSIRDVFSAVLSVFSTPVSSETRSEVGHKQLQLRSQFDVLVENLEDPGSLSLLLMALVRIWSILKKPDEEIGLMVEHAMYWPTVIGSPGSVNADHVFRTLSSTLHHSLTVHPNYDSWMILHAEIHYATGKYGAALLNYLKAGAVTSRHFEDEVPPLVWSMQVYRKMISCCTQLNLHTHAVLLCQLLVPMDYELAFSLLSTHSSLMAESYFTYFWDMVIIEYLIYINAKRGDKNKQSLATQIAGQPELNCNNSPEVLARAAQVRRRKLLQSFYDQSFSTL